MMRFLRTFAVLLVLGAWAHGAASIANGSISLASDGVTFTGTLSGGTGTGYTPTSGLTNYSITVGGVARALSSSTVATATWTGVAYTPIASGATVTVVVATGNLRDSGSNTATTGTVAVTNNSTQTAANAVAAQRSILSTDLATWRTARETHASSRVEVVGFGDSTTADSGGSYSWLYDTKHKAIAAGYTNGGRGMLDGSGETATRSGPDENLSGVLSSTGFAGGSDTYDFFGTSMFDSATVGNVITFQGYGRCRIYYSRFSNRGQFTYAVDGGSATTVDAYSATALDTSVVDLALDDTLHTVAVTNVGRPSQAPTRAGGSASTASGTLAAGTYFYKFTTVTGSGETLPTVATSGITLAAPGHIDHIFSKAVTTGTTRVYRSTSSGGTYQLVASGASNTNGNYTITDDGSGTPGATPPATDTSGADPGVKDVHVLPDFVKAAGIVWHKNAISGAGFGTFGFSAAATNNFQYQPSLGLTQVQTSAGPTVNAVAATRPPWRAPKLSINALGINDQQSAQTSTTAVMTGLETWRQACVAAGSDMLRVIPHYSRSGSPTTAKPFIDAEKAWCVSNNVPWVDFNAVLDNVGFTGAGPHITQAGYNSEGDYVWDSALGPTAIPASGNNSEQGNLRTGTSRLGRGGSVR